MESYHPASDISRATHFFSTDDIARAIAELKPGEEISKSEIFDALEEAGYQWQTDPEKMNFSLKWMVTKQG